MIIIIDGYNVIRHFFFVKMPISERDRRRFIEYLTRYQEVKKYPIDIILVFDGGESTHPFKERCQQVLVVFSGHHMTADEWIIDYTKKESIYNACLVLVSQDHELIHKCEDYSVYSLDSALFVAIVKDVLEGRLLAIKGKKNVNKKTIHKIEQNASLDEEMIGRSVSRDLDALMEQFSGGTGASTKHEHALKTVESKKLSRKEKKLYTILEKLY